MKIISDIIYRQAASGIIAVLFKT